MINSVKHNSTIYNYGGHTLRWISLVVEYGEQLVLCGVDNNHVVVLYNVMCDMHMGQ